MSLSEEAYHQVRLPGHPAPFADEDLNSLLFRAGMLNQVQDVGALRGMLGFDGGGLSPKAQLDQVAFALGLSPEEVDFRWVRDACNAGRPGFVHWFGTFLPKELVRVQNRRFPASSIPITHTPSFWLLEVASHCPHSLISLTNDCPQCGRKQPWNKAASFDECAYQECRAPLGVNQPELLSEGLASDYHNAFCLVDPDVSKRNSKRLTLPGEFHDWDAGDVFMAVLGFAGAKRGLERAQAGRKDPFKGGREYRNLTAGHIAFGFHALANWDESLVELFETFQRTVGTPRYREGIASMEAYLTQGGKQDRIKGLVEATAPKAIRRSGTAFYAVTGSATLNSARSGLISVGDARSKYRIDNRTLQRLVPAGRCFHAQSISSGGAVLFDEAKLEAVVYRYRQSVDYVRAAKSLGVPSFVIPAMVRAGLLEDVQCSDVALLTSNKPVLESSSLELLRSQLTGTNGRRKAEYIPLQSLMAWVVSPAVWVALCEAIIRAELQPNRVSETPGLPPLERLGLPKKVFANWIKSQPGTGHADWGCIEATKSDARLVLNTNDNAIRAAISMEFLEPIKARQEKIQFSSLEEFAKNWISCETVASWEGESPMTWFRRFEAQKLPKLQLSIAGQKPYLTLFCRPSVQHYCDSTRASRSALSHI
ncbi:hypothetical protein [Maricaulis sp.]|uniref:hypothetical protein n=1 Tax=Maricaulis sp. TaxID=1486257 RepID=UPI003A93B8B2